jgi:hypothetical protein
VEAVFSFLYTGEIKDEFAPFTLPEDLVPGSYLMIFTVMGHDKKIIAKTEKAIYYLADKSWEFEDIKVCYPGISVTHLIPPGAMVLFEASVSAAAGLDPYIAWYSGRNRIGGGKVSDGAGKLLWEIPNQDGFVRIRAEALPFPPIGRQNSQSAYSPAGPLLKGKVKELSIPVSSKGEIRGALAPLIESAEIEGEKTLQYYYQFAGNLKDSKNAEKSSDLVLLKTNGKEETPSPLWLSSGTLYGLQVGPENIYRGPAFPLETAPGDTEHFSFIFRLKPMADGILFTASLGETGMKLSREDGKAALTLTVDGQIETLNAEIPEGDEFITLPVDIVIKAAAVTNIALRQGYLDEGSRLTVSFGGQEKSLALPDLPRGSLSIRLGSEKAAIPAPKEDAVKKAAESPAPEAADETPPETVLSETALLEPVILEPVLSETALSEPVILGPVLPGPTEPVSAPALIKAQDLPVMILDEFVLLRWKEKPRVVASGASPEA